MIWKDKLLLGDCKEIVTTLPDNCVDCVVTSPPYWNLSCLLYTSPSPRDRTRSRMPSSA